MISKILAPNGRLLVKEVEQENKTSGGVGQGYLAMMREVAKEIKGV